MAPKIENKLILDPARYPAEVGDIELRREPIALENVLDALPAADGFLLEDIPLPQAQNVFTSPLVRVFAGETGLQSQIRGEIIDQIGIGLFKYFSYASSTRQLTVVVDMSSGKIVPLAEARENPPAAYYAQSVFVDPTTNRITFSEERRAILRQMAQDADPSVRAVAAAFEGLDGAKAIDTGGEDIPTRQLGMGEAVVEVVERPSMEAVSRAQKALHANSNQMTVMGSGGMVGYLAVPVLIGVVRLDADGNIIGKDMRLPSMSSARGSHHMGGIQEGTPVAVVVGKDGTLYSAEPVGDLNPRQRAMMDALLDASAEKREEVAATSPYALPMVEAELDGMIHGEARNPAGELPLDLAYAIDELPRSKTATLTRSHGEISLVWSGTRYEFIPTEKLPIGTQVYGRVAVDFRVPRSHDGEGKLFYAFEPDAALPPAVGETIESLLEWMGQKVQRGTFLNRLDGFF